MGKRQRKKYERLQRVWNGPKPKTALEWLIQFDRYMHRQWYNTGLCIPRRLPGYMEPTGPLERHMATVIQVLESGEPLDTSDNPTRIFWGSFIGEYPERERAWHRFTERTQKRFGNPSVLCWNISDYPQIQYGSKKARRQRRKAGVAL